MRRCINVAVAGLGRIGRLHAYTIKYHIPSAELIAVVDIIPERVKKVANELKVKPYTDFLQLLEKQEDVVDAVIIATPTHTHKEIILLAMEYGKDIFCEKPLTSTLDDAFEISNKIYNRGVILQVGYMRRFDFVYNYAHNLIHSDAIGDILAINFITCDSGKPPSWVFNRKLSGGIFLDMLSHEIDLARYFVNSEVKLIHAHGKVSYFKEAEQGNDLDTAFLSIIFENGTMCNIYGCRRIANEYKIIVEIFGSKGQILIDYDLLKYRSMRIRAPTLNTATEPWFIKRFYYAYIKEIKHFVNCVITGTKPEVDLWDGLEAVRISTIAWQSFERQEIIQLKE